MPAENAFMQWIFNLSKQYLKSYTDGLIFVNITKTCLYNFDLLKPQKLMKECVHDTG